jgi:TolB-like protein/tetratricopeptide (TPR) repeat protein
VPPDLDVLVARALAKDRTRRFQTAEEMGEALGLIAAHTTLERSTPGGSGRERRVTPVEAAGPASGRDSPAAGRRLLVAAALVGLLVLLAVALLSLRGQTPEVPSPGQPPAGAAPGESYLSSIAILRPQVLGGSPQVAALGPGIAVEIESQLRRIPGLRIISDASVKAVQDQGLTTRQIADSLRVEHLVAGTVQSDGRTVRVTLQLVDAASDNVAWSKPFEQPLRDMLMRQPSIAQEVAVALVNHVPGLRVGAMPAGSRNVDAVEAYTQGVELLARSDEESLDRSIRAFERALRADPGYAAAAAGLAQALAIYVHLGYVRLRPEPYRTFADAARWANRAVELDGTLPEAWGARAMTRLYTGAPPAAALQDVERAIALAPSSGQLRNQRGIVLARLGRYADAVQDSETGAELDPLSAVTRTGSIAVTAIGARRYDVAQREAARALARDPDFQGGRIVLAVAHALGGSPGRCLELGLGERFPEVHALCLELSGRPAHADQMLAPVRDAYANGRYFGVYQLGFVAALYALRGDAAQTLQWLERAYERSPTGFDFRFLDSGLFDRVREDPAYLRGLERIRQRIRARFAGGA